MCGIVAYTGKKQAAKILYTGLERLEYRGYDSAGIAVINGENISVVKRAGRVSMIKDAVSLSGTCGVGHTRWATHGGAEDKNAHPHVCKKFAVVHNGIIENYARLKEELSAAGRSFSSDTDSETVALLLTEYYEGDFLNAVKRTVARLKGSFALCILCLDFPNEIVCVRRKSPLIVGTDASGVYAASDIPALGECNKIRVLEDGEIALLKKTEIKLFDFSLSPLPLRLVKNKFRREESDRGNYPHYMLKEIYESPVAIEKTAACFDLTAAEKLKKAAHGFTCGYVVGCGTAYHSAITGAALLEKTLKIPFIAELSSEFCYRKPLLGKNSLVIAVSQSGETADTVSACRLAKNRGAFLAVVTNADYSTIAALADCRFVTDAGVEIGVAATKTYAAQLAAFYSLCACLQGNVCTFLHTFSHRVRPVFSEISLLKQLAAQKIATARGVYFIGRGADYASAIEGSLKLREVSYVSGAGYAAGELKHGSIALIDNNATVIAVITQKALKEKSVNAVNEVRSRGAFVVAITPFSDIPADETVLLPDCPQKYYPLYSAIPLQLLAYYTAVELGRDPDRPRNLAKSVTVE